MFVWKAIGISVLVFVAGALSGFAGGYLYSNHQLRAVFHVSPDNPGYADRVVDGLLAKWAGQLNLDPNQKAMLNDELKGTAYDIKSLRFETVSKFDQLLQQHVEQIEAKLPPEKRTRFHDLAKAEEDRWGIRLRPQ